MEFTSVPSLKAPLEEQIQRLVEQFPRDLLRSECEGLLLIGSASRGEATYRSDLDLLVVIRNPPLKYERVRALRERIEQNISEELLNAPLPTTFQFVLPSAFQTREPAMFDALKQAIILVDPEGTLDEMRKAGILSREVA